ncbi:hypothetical protein EG827_14285, partial [bacterium]|nr:hypothetical protein [bacterium]
YNLVTCILDMQSGGLTVNLVTLREELDRRGVHFPRGGKHPSIMRLWLEKAGIFTSGYRVNEAVLEDLMGMTKPEIEALVTLTTQQSAFLRAFASVGSDDVPSNEIEMLAREAYGVTFNEKSLPKDVLYPLEKAGYITLKRGTQGGRGAKPFLVSGTDKLVTDVIEPLLEQFSVLLNPELIPYLRKSIHDILEDLDTDDRHIKGLALEAFAMKVIQLLGLEVTSIRLRGVDTGGAEVDVVAEREDITFRRWQVQCKNTATVRLEDIAKEVGVASVTKANTIIIMTTGSVTEDGKRYTDKVIQDTNLFIAIVDGADVRAIADNPTAIIAILRREARRAARLRQAGN